MQLSSTDGKVHFFVDDTEVGVSYRDDNTDLGEEIGLYTMFTAPLTSWGTDKPYTIWDDVTIGSDYRLGEAVVPEPATIVVWSLLGLTVAGFGLWRRKRAA